MATESKKAKALDLAINQIDRQFGKGSICVWVTIMLVLVIM